MYEKIEIVRQKDTINIKKQYLCPVIENTRIKKELWNFQLK